MEKVFWKNLGKIWKNWKNIFSKIALAATPRGLGGEILKHVSNKMLLCTSISDFIKISALLIFFNTNLGEVLPPPEESAGEIQKHVSNKIPSYPENFNKIGLQGAERDRKKIHT